MALRLVMGLVAIALIAGALVLLRRPTGGRPGAGLGPLDARTPALNEPAPNFALSDTSGHPIRLSELRGQVVLVNFWATWCVPCRQEMPTIAQVYDEQRSQGFTVLEVNEQESPETVRSFTEQVGAIPPVVLDRDGSVMRQYRLKGLPDSFLIDRQGVVRGLSYGPISRQIILTYIDSARESGP